MSRARFETWRAGSVLRVCQIVLVRHDDPCRLERYRQPLLSGPPCTEPDVGFYQLFPHREGDRYWAPCRLIGRRFSLQCLSIASKPLGRPMQLFRSKGSDQSVRWLQHIAHKRPYGRGDFATQSR